MIRNLAWLVVVAWFVNPSAAWAQDASTGGDELVVKQKKGLQFKLPADWPIEERDGLVSPIPIEEYLSRKFTAVNARLEALHKAIGDLQTRMYAVEQELRENKKVLQSAVEPGEPLVERTPRRARTSRITIGPRP